MYLTAVPYKASPDPLEAQRLRSDRETGNREQGTAHGGLLHRLTSLPPFLWGRPHLPSLVRVDLWEGTPHPKGQPVVVLLSKG